MTKVLVTNVTGPDGASAYEVAVSEGFVGTEAAWLTSLVGSKGADGIDGVDGVDGIDGKSAYQLALDAGFVGTEAQWRASLKGDPGTAAPPTALNDMTDVDTTAAVDGDFLSLVSGVWTPVDAPAGGSVGAMVFRGPWSAVTAYAEDDVVTLGDAAFVANLANTNRNPATDDGTVTSTTVQASSVKTVQSGWTTSNNQKWAQAFTVATTKTINRISVRMNGASGGSIGIASAVGGGNVTSLRQVAFAASDRSVPPYTAVSVNFADLVLTAGTTYYAYVLHDTATGGDAVMSTANANATLVNFTPGGTFEGWTTQTYTGFTADVVLSFYDPGSADPWSVLSPATAAAVSGSSGGDMVLSPGGKAPYIPSTDRIALALTGSGVVSGLGVGQHAPLTVWRQFANGTPAIDLYNGASRTVTITPTNAGDTILLAISHSNPGGFDAQPTGAGATWTRVQTQAVGGYTLDLWTGVNPTVGSTTVTITGSPAGNNHVYTNFIAEVVGGSVVSTAKSSGSGTAISAPAVTPEIGDVIVSFMRGSTSIMTGISGSGDTWASPDVNTYDGNTDQAMAAAHVTATASTSHQLTATVGSGAWTGMTVVMRAAATPNMSVDVGVGSILAAGSQVAVTAANPSVTTAHATLDRYDIVSVSSSGVVSITAGTANANPVWPSAPAGNVVLAAIYVTANKTSIVSADLADLRVPISSKPWSSAPIYTWTSTASFVTGDYAGYSGDLYKATANNTNVTPDPVQHPQIPAPNVANAAAWQLNGGCTIDSTGLVLMSGQGSASRTAIYTTLVPLDGLDVTFDWTTTGGADGFSFALLDPANSTNTSIGGGNVGLQGIQGIRLTWDYYSGANWARLFYDDVQVGTDLAGGTGSATVQVQMTLVSGNTYSLTVKRNGVTIVNAQQITTDFSTARLAFGCGSGGISATTKVTALSCPPVSTWTRVLDAVGPTELAALSTRVTATEAFGPRLTTAETNISSQIARLGALETGAPVLLRTATHGGSLSSFVFTPVGGASAAGRLLVVACNVSQYNSTRTVTPPSGWTLRLDQLNGLNRQFVFTKVAGSAETTTYTFGITSGENHSAVFAEFSGGDFRGIIANTTASATAAALTDPVGGRSGISIWWSSAQNNGASTVSTGWSKSTEVSSGGTWAGIVMANTTAPTTATQSLAPVVTTTMSPIVGSATILVGTEPANGHVIRDEGVQLPQRGSLDFVGANVTATDDSANGKTVVTVVGSNRLYQDWAGVWSSTVDYPQGAIVSRNYGLYVALQDPAMGSDPISPAPTLGVWNAGANTVTSTNWSGVTSVAFKFQVTSAIRVKGVSERWGGTGAAGTFGLASAIGATITWLTDSSGAQTKISVTPTTGTVTATFTGHVDLTPGVDYFVVADLCAGNLARADTNSMPNTGITQSAMYYGSTYGSSDSFTRGEFRLYSETGVPWDLLVSPTGGSSPVMASYKSTVGEANSPLPNSPSAFAEWRTAARLTLAAAVGQKILCSGSAFLDNGANTYYFDWGIVNATTGAIIRRFGGAYGQGFASGAAYNSPSLSADFIVQSEDIVSGNVTIAQLWMGNSSRNLLLLDYIYGIRAVNLG